MRIEFAAIKSRGAVARYVAQYGDGKYPQWKAVADKLRELPPERHTPASISAIIGGKSWTHPSCRECGNYVDVAIMLGDESDNSVSVCLPCLKSAAAALSAAQSAMAALQPIAPTGDA